MGIVAIVDYGTGNAGSIRNMLSRIGVSAVITAEPVDLIHADRLILPGVGAFDNAIRNLQSRGLVSVLTDIAMHQRKPVLGICLGMQMMGRSSEEGTLPGLAWVAAETRRFHFDGALQSLRVPHMGWNAVVPTKPNPLWTGLPDAARFYFVHSFHVRCDTEADVAATTDYGGAFTSAFACRNLYGVQFHPEKSHRCGMALLKTFSEIS